VGHNGRLFPEKVQKRLKRVLKRKHFRQENKIWAHNLGTSLNTMKLSNIPYFKPKGLYNGSFQGFSCHVRDNVSYKW